MTDKAVAITSAERVTGARDTDGVSTLQAESLFSNPGSNHVRSNIDSREDYLDIASLWDDKSIAGEQTEDTADRRDEPQDTRLTVSSRIADMLSDGKATGEEQAYIDAQFSAAFDRDGLAGKDELRGSINDELKANGAQFRMKRQYTDAPELRPVEAIADAVANGVIDAIERKGIVAALNAVYNEGGQVALDETLAAVNSKLYGNQRLLSVPTGSKHMGAIALDLYDSSTKRGVPVVNTVLGEGENFRRNNNE